MKHIVMCVVSLTLLILLGCESSSQGEVAEITEEATVQETTLTPTDLPVDDIGDATSEFTPHPTTQPVLVAESVVLTIITRGGLCQYGMCYQEATIQADGHFRVEIGLSEPITRQGMLDVARIQEIQQEVARTDFAAIRAVPFMDVCPTAYDGQEFIYTFYVEDGLEQLSSCEFVLDDNHPLLRLIYRLQAQLAEQIQ